MSFWAYMLHCKGGYFYTGHTDDLEHRMAQHASGQVPGFVRDHWPAKLVWSDEFPTRYEALAAERQLKGWSRAKKLALIRGDWDSVRRLSRSRQEEGQGFDRLSPNGERVAFSLAPHPGSPSRAVEAVGVSLASSGGRWLLAYHVTGGLLSLPAAAMADRSDGLWQTTCFELFVQTSGEAYYELNFAPSTQWAAYRFDGYRSGMRDAAMSRPLIITHTSNDGFELRAEVALPEDAVGRLGLSAIIEETDGTKSYWALAHPPGEPDFHHPDCFALHIPAPDAA